jgi:hypothetical protein
VYIFYLFEAVYISHVLSLEKKGLECSTGGTCVHMNVFTYVLYLCQETSFFNSVVLHERKKKAAVKLAPGTLRPYFTERVQKNQKHKVAS